MERRQFITSLIAIPTLGLLAACGSDGGGDTLSTSDTTPAVSPSTEVTPSTDAAPSTEAPPATEASPVDDAPAAAEPVLSYTTPGGFTTREFAFQNPPIVLVASDGTMITGAVTPAVFPGPLLPRHQTQTVSSDGIEELLAAADAAGLLAEVDYSSDEALLIADAPTSRLVIIVDGTTYTHAAEALGVGGGPGSGGTESTEARQSLLDFLTALQSDPASIIGAENLGEPADYMASAYQLLADPVDDLSGFEPAPTIEPWPTDAGVELASAGSCVEVPREAIGDLLESATQLTFFSENDVTYQVAARPAYPGRTC